MTLSYIPMIAKLKPQSLLRSIRLINCFHGKQTKTCKFVNKSLCFYLTIINLVGTHLQCFGVAEHGVETGVHFGAGIHNLKNK